MTQWKGRITLLNSLGWMFLSKLNNTQSAIRCAEEANIIVESLKQSPSGLGPRERDLAI
jgi:hypothetical protein